MRINKEDSRRYTDWLEYAENDLLAANALCKQERTLLLSAFCSHQAIEKALKAYLLYEKGYAPDGHNVIFLCKQAARSVPSFKQWIDECVELNGYYISTRYPPDFPLHIDKKKAASLHKMAKSLYVFVFKTLTGAIYEA
ncbi:MAG: HEPN domain-containing protein [Ruminococcaceae bacterium]|nr:HEPN domain-containing protein [Oscillospiraceae bacterium]